MAIFPKKIALKNSRNAQGRLEELIGNSSLSPGELVYQTQGETYNLYGRTAQGTIKKLGAESFTTPQVRGFTYEPFIASNFGGTITLSTPPETQEEDLLVVLLTFRSVNAQVETPDITAVGWESHFPANLPATNNSVWTIPGLPGVDPVYMFAQVLTRSADAEGAQSFDVAIDYDFATSGHDGASATVVALYDESFRLGVYGIDGTRSVQGDTPYVSMDTPANIFNLGMAYGDFGIVTQQPGALSDYGIPENPIDGWSYISGDHATNLTTTAADQPSLSTVGYTSSATGFSAARSNPYTLPTLDEGGRAGLIYVSIAAKGGAIPNIKTIDEIEDVDTSSVLPDVGDMLTWNGSTWIPSAQPPLMGSPTGTVVRINETLNSTAGEATATKIGSSGFLVSLQTDQAAWVVGYNSAAARTADSGRAFGDDPIAGDGVLFEALCDGLNLVYATPGTAYFNAEPSGAEAIYLNVRDSSTSLAVDCLVTINAYKHQGFNQFGTSRISTSVVPDASGKGVFTDIGQSGQFASALCNSTETPWLTFYTTEAARDADARGFGQAIPDGSGIACDFYLASGVKQSATPSKFYHNADFIASEAIYFKVRNSSNTPITDEVFVEAYAEGEITTIDGGTFGSG